MQKSDSKLISNILNNSAVIVKYVQVITTGGAIAVALINYSIASKLTPLEQSVGDVVEKVKAIEEDRKTVPDWRTRTAILEQRVNADHESINEIKNNVEAIKNFLLNK